MSLEISIARRAEQDMTLQYRWYLDNADFAVAERYLLAVDETIQSIAAQPDLGIRRHFAAPELASIQHPASSIQPRPHLSPAKNFGSERLSVRAGTGRPQPHPRHAPRAAPRGSNSLEPRCEEWSIWDRACNLDGFDFTPR